MENAAGASVASPTPTPMRANASVPKLPATLPSVVIMLHTIDADDDEIATVQRSAMSPIGTPRIA